MANNNFPDLHGLGAEAVAACEAAITRGDYGLVLIAPPGSTATMIARRVPSLFAPLTDHESRWIAATYDGEGPGACYAPYRRAQNPASYLPDGRPFRAPHHSVSGAALVSESRLARCGVLYLDELPEFSAPAIRELSRALPGISAPFAPFILASATPCPCGFHGYPEIRACVCSPAQISHHTDRIDRMRRMLKLDGAAITVPELSLRKLRVARQSH
jgi:magnesium chelatase family protein